MLRAVSREAQDEEKRPDGRSKKPKPLRVGVQISRSVHLEVSTPDTVR